MAVRVPKGAASNLSASSGPAVQADGGVGCDRLPTEVGKSLRRVRWSAASAVVEGVWVSFGGKNDTPFGVSKFGVYLETF